MYKVLCITLEKIAFVGDDVLDLPVMQVCAISFALTYAYHLVLRQASYIIQAAGGYGVVREEADKILLSRLGNLANVNYVLLKI